MVGEVVVVRCPTCKGWTRALRKARGVWVVPHFRRGKGKLCRASSTLAGLDRKGAKA